jgi:hypothetical protein
MKENLHWKEHCDGIKSRMEILRKLNKQQKRDNSVQVTKLRKANPLFEEAEKRVKQA